MHCTPSHRSFPNVSFKTVPVLIWLTLSCLSKRILLLSASSFFASLLQAVSGTWIWQSVLSSFSMLQMLWATSHLWRLLCMVCLSSWSFPLPGHVQDSMSTGVCLWCKRCNDYDNDDNVKPWTAVAKEHLSVKDHPGKRTSPSMKDHHGKRTPQWKTTLAKPKQTKNTSLNERPPCQKNALLDKRLPWWETPLLTLMKDHPAKRTPLTLEEHPSWWKTNLVKEHPSWWKTALVKEHLSLTTTFPNPFHSYFHELWARIPFIVLFL